MIENTAELIINNAIDTGYSRKRKYLIEIICVLKEKLKFHSQTMYLAIYYMDLIIIKFGSNSKLIPSIELIAISCLLIAAKFDENDPDIPELQHFQTIFSKKNDLSLYFTLSDIKKSEVKCLMALNYKLNYFSSYHFLIFFFTHGVISDSEAALFIKNRYLEQPSENKVAIVKIIERIYSLSREILDLLILENDVTVLTFSSHHIALAVILFAKELFFQYENCIKEGINFIEQVYGIKFDQYEKCFLSLNSICEKFDKKNYRFLNEYMSRKENNVDKKTKTIFNEEQHKILINELAESLSISNKLLRLEKLKYEKVAKAKVRAISNQKDEKKNYNPKLTINIEEMKMKTLEPDQKNILKMKEFSELKNSDKILTSLDDKEIRAIKKNKTEMLKYNIYKEKDKNIKSILENFKKENVIVAKYSNENKKKSSLKVTDKNIPKVDSRNDVIDILDYTKKIFSKIGRNAKLQEQTGQSQSEIDNNKHKKIEDKTTIANKIYTKIPNESYTKNPTANPSTIIINNNININTFINYDNKSTNYGMKTNNLQNFTSNSNKQENVFDAVKMSKYRKDSYNISNVYNSYNPYESYTFKYDSGINRVEDKYKQDAKIFNLKINNQQFDKKENNAYGSNCAEINRNFYNEYEKDFRKNLELTGNKPSLNNYLNKDSLAINNSKMKMNNKKNDYKNYAANTLHNMDVYQHYQMTNGFSGRYKGSTGLNLNEGINFLKNNYHS